MISVLPSFGNFSTLTLGFIVLCLIVEHKICGSCVFGMVFLLVWGEMILCLWFCNSLEGLACGSFSVVGWISLLIGFFLFLAVEGLNFYEYQFFCTIAIESLLWIASLVLGGYCRVESFFSLYFCNSDGDKEGPFFWGG